MTSILPEPDQEAPFRVVQSLQEINEHLLLLAGAIIQAVTCLNNSLDLFWNKPDEEILAIMNLHGPVRMQQIFTQHEARAAQLNDIAAELGVNNVACKIGAQKPVQFNAETGLFEMNWPTPQPEPDPNPPLSEA